MLGCTHFPLLRPAIERVAGPDVTVIDSGVAVARQARHVLAERHLLRQGNKPLSDEERLQVYCSGDPLAFSAVASMVLGRAIHARQALATTQPQP